ncbi:hypothetical protein Leryth_009436 [Lithospermum erythrorhizon]|nr:hypothetical protein Leryth_009436 [Lithospermum erythrorhizon]
MEKVMGLAAESPVVIFARRDCVISYTIETLIRSFGAYPTVYDLDNLQDREEIREALGSLGCNDMPAVFIGKKFIGGSNEVMSLNVKGELKPKLIRAKAIWM